MVGILAIRQIKIFSEYYIIKEFVQEIIAMYKFLLLLLVIKNSYQTEYSESILKNKIIGGELITAKDIPYQVILILKM